MNLPGLTAGRFLAALYVFIFHINLRTPLSYLPWWLQNIVNVGALGVNFFFALSGFLLCISYQNKEIGYRQFMYKRFARIYPVYLFGLLLTFAVNVWTGEYPDKKVVLADTLMVESIFYPIADSWYGGGGWSVSTEAAFYAIFPVILPLLLRINSKALLFSLLLFIILISSLPGLLYIKGIIGTDLMYAFPLSRLPEFLVGMILALLVSKFDFNLNIWVSLPFFALAAIWLVYFSPFYPGFVIHNVFILPAILCALILLMKDNRVIGSEPMVFAGKISYSFYICQIALTFVIDLLLKYSIIYKHDFAVLPVAFVINLLLAIFTYHVIERPFHRLLS